MAFTRRMTVTIQSGQVTGTLTDFPVLVSVTHADLKTISNGGYVANANGYDIRFFSDVSLSSALYFNLVSYDGAAGAIRFWVLNASVASGTVFYAGFGDASLNSNISSTSTWSNHFEAVWMFGDGSTLSLADSSSHGRTLTNNNGATATSGQVYGGVNLASASSQSLSKAEASGSILSGAWTAFTVSMWVNITSYATAYSTFFYKNDNGGHYDLLYLKNTGKLACYTPGGNYDGTGTYTVSNSTWTHIAMTIDGSTLKGYVNGLLDKSISAGISTSNADVVLGRDVNNGHYVNGIIDEVRVADVVRTVDWLAAEYNNQVAPGTFASYAFAAASAGGARTQFYLIG